MIELIATDPVPRGEFGISAVIDGDRAVIGRWSDGSLAREAGSALVFVPDSAAPSWSQEAELHASDPRAWAAFGCAVDSNGDMIVVGAFRDDENGVDAGAAHLFGTSGPGLWSETLKIGAPGGAGSGFGAAVAMTSGFLAIGAPFERGEGCDRGAVYVYATGADGWSPAARIPSPAGAIAFGGALAADGEILVAGAVDSGKVWVYRVGEPAFPVLESLLEPVAGGVDGRFGQSVAVSGDLVVVGEPTAADAGGRPGMAHVFRRLVAPEPTWVEQANLTSPQALHGGLFGMAVAIDGRRLVIGAPREGASSTGVAHVFEQDAAGLEPWSLLHSVVPAESENGDHLGRAVSMVGDQFLVGAYLENSLGRAAGAAFLVDVVRYGSRETVGEARPQAVERIAPAFPSPASVPRSSPAPGFFNVSIKELGPSFPGFREVLTRIAAAHAVGAGTKIHWDQVEPVRGAWDFTSTDTVIGALAQASLEPLVTVRDTPSWASAGIGEEDFWRYPPADIQHWEDALTEMVGRYGSAGSNTVHRWEIWNEPNNESFFSGGASDYVELLNAAHRAITAADPLAEVWAPALTFHPWSDENDWSFLDQVIAEGRFDVFSIHLYFSDVSEMVEIVRTVRQKLDEANLGGIPLAVTEVNRIEHIVDCGRFAALGPSIHAQSLTEILLALHDEGVDSVFWFKATIRGQRCAAPDDFHETLNGLLDRSRMPLMSYEAFRVLAEGRVLVFGDGFESGDELAWGDPCAGTGRSQRLLDIFPD